MTSKGLKRIYKAVLDVFMNKNKCLRIIIALLIMIIVSHGSIAMASPKWTLKNIPVELKGELSKRGIVLLNVEIDPVVKGYQDKSAKGKYNITISMFSLPDRVNNDIGICAKTIGEVSESCSVGLYNMILIIGDTNNGDMLATATNIKYCRSYKGHKISLQQFLSNLKTVALN